MIHFRAIIFQLFDAGKTDQEVIEYLRSARQTEFSPPRMANYREAYEKLDAAGRQEYIAGKRDLLGKPT